MTVEQRGLESAGPAGMDDVQFLVRTNVGADYGPLHKIASGGETARFFLALQLCLAASGEGRTQIFDEVDVGVGGAVAAAIGARLTALGRVRQVIAITHSPQVAAAADVQWKIAKTITKEGIDATGIDRLDRDMRCEEIARMLAGAEVSAEARAAAAKLLARA